MAEIEIPREIDRFVLYFDTPRKQINAVALATALVGLADAVREANILINPGYQVEVVVEALEGGSFQAIVRTVYNATKDLFGSEPAKAIVYSVIASYIYQQTLAPDAITKIIVQDDMVVVESGHDRVVIPKDVFDAKDRLERSERFTSSVGNIVGAAKLDSNIVGIGIKTQPDKTRPDIYISRDRFAIFDNRRPEEGVREIVEFANLEISRAIMARGNRKWEFFWRGVKVSAPIMDSQFFDKFFAHEITIAPGDILRVSLRIIQKRHADTGIYINDKYEVIEVFEHIPKMRQGAL